MVLNYIWVAFFVIAFLIALVKLVFLGDYQVFPSMMEATFASAKTGFELSLGLTGVLAFWLGMMKIGERSGLIDRLGSLHDAFSELEAMISAKKSTDEKKSVEISDRL